MRAKKGAAVLAIRSGKLFDIGPLRPARASGRAAGAAAAAPASTVLTKHEMYDLLSGGEQKSVDDLLVALYRRRHA
jgi:hypothetical protein